MSRLERNEPNEEQQRQINLALSTIVPIPEMLGEPRVAAELAKKLPKGFLRN